MNKMKKYVCKDGKVGRLSLVILIGVCVGLLVGVLVLRAGVSMQRDRQLLEYYPQLVSYWVQDTCTNEGRVSGEKVKCYAVDYGFSEDGNFYIDYVKEVLEFEIEGEGTTDELVERRQVFYF